MFTMDEYWEYTRERREKEAELKKQKATARIEELKQKGLYEQYLKYHNAPKQDFHGDCDHPNTMENSTATVLYIIVMIGGLIFNARWLIWIVASLVYFRFITRHSRKK